MAKAIFTKRVGYTSPKSIAGWHAEPSPDPQPFPEEFIAYAVEAGAATRADGKDEAPPAEPAKK